MTQKIDRRKKYMIMLDTETCNGIVEENGKLNLDFSLVYDLGIMVVDKYGNIFEEHSLIIDEIFFGERDMMQSAYYANKLPNYFIEIGQGTRKIVKWYKAVQLVKSLMEKYNTNVVVAHNASFDYRALNNTQRWLTKSKYRYFFPYGTEVWCTLKMARQVVANTPMYKHFCYEHDYTTATGRVKLTAEVLYRYITQDHDFIESHTGLEDVAIEKEILAYCIAKKKKMEKRLWAD